MNDSLKLESEQKIPVQENRPNESGVLLFDGAIRIFDKETKEVFLESRA